MGGFFKKDGKTRPINDSKPKGISRNKMTESKTNSIKYKQSSVVRNKREEHTSLAEELRGQK